MIDYKYYKSNRCEISDDKDFIIILHRFDFVYYYDLLYLTNNINNKYYICMCNDDKMAYFDGFIRAMTNYIKVDLCINL